MPQLWPEHWEAKPFNAWNAIFKEGTNFFHRVVIRTLPRTLAWQILILIIVCFGILGIPDFQMLLAPPPVPAQPGGTLGGSGRFGSRRLSGINNTALQVPEKSPQVLHQCALHQNCSPTWPLSQQIKYVVRNQEPLLQFFSGRADWRMRTSVAVIVAATGATYPLTSRICLSSTVAVAVASLKHSESIFETSSQKQYVNNKQICEKT